MGPEKTKLQAWLDDRHGRSKILCGKTSISRNEMSHIKNGKKRPSLRQCMEIELAIPSINALELCRDEDYATLLAYQQRYANQQK